MGGWRRPQRLCYLSSLWSKAGLTEATSGDGSLSITALRGRGRVCQGSSSTAESSVPPSCCCLHCTQSLHAPSIQWGNVQVQYSQQYPMCITSIGETGVLGLTGFLTVYERTLLYLSRLNLFDKIIRSKQYCCEILFKIIFYFNIFVYLFLWWQCWNFSIINPIFNIWFDLNISVLKIILLLHILVEIMIQWYSFSSLMIIQFIYMILRFYLLGQKLR